MSLGYIASKIFWLVMSPPSLLVILLAIGFVFTFMRREALQRFGRRLVSAAVVMLLIASTVPIGDWLLTPLENRFPQSKLPEQVYGIITLGGTENEVVSYYRGQPSINYAGERLIHFMKLSREYPEAKLAYAGGTGRFDVGSIPVTEAKIAFDLLKHMGMTREDIIFEDQSKNTYQNAANATKLIGEGIKKPWVLVTSAFHLSRAVGVFRKYGWNVIPYPAGYFTTGKYETNIRFDVTRNLGQLHMAAHEWVGHLAYWLFGWMDDFMPGPET